MFIFIKENATKCQEGNQTAVEGDSFILCGVRGAGAWPPVINATFLDVERDHIVFYNDTSNDLFALNFSIKANRTLNNEILNFSCDTYFPAPNSLPQNTYNRHHSNNAPKFLDSCNEVLLMDIQCMYFTHSIGLLLLLLLLL